jgi:micrococcal nuclease|tara:strand:- start:929 stop:1333 length:405 start_codon:yes stop_codon:yes gene_type:complete
MYEYNCRITKIIDGDTVDVDIDLGFNQWFCNQRIRLHGIDTPESRTRDLEEKKYGLRAKKFVEDFIPVGSSAIIETKKRQKGDKYGRYLGDFRVGNKRLCEELLKSHNAVPYRGKSKSDIKKAHLINRKKLNAQ